MLGCGRLAPGTLEEPLLARWALEVPVASASLPSLPALLCSSCEEALLAGGLLVGDPPSRPGSDPEPGKGLSGGREAEAARLSFGQVAEGALNVTPSWVWLARPAHVAAARPPD